MVMSKTEHFGGVFNVLRSCAQFALTVLAVVSAVGRTVYYKLDIFSLYV